MPAVGLRVDQLDDGGQDARVRLGKDAVAQVEDVTRAGAVGRRGQHGTGWRPPRRATVPGRARGRGCPARHGRPRSAGALRRGGRASRRRPRRIRQTPISPRSSPVPTPKRIVGTPRSAMPARTARVAGRAKRAYSVGGERAGPAVEELHRLGTGLDLGAQRGHRHGGQPVGQLLPQLGVPVHERLDLGEGPGGAALHGVAGHGERCAGEADQRHARPGQFPADESAPSRRRRERRPPARRAGGGPGRPRCGRARPRRGLGPAPRRRRSRWRAAARRCRRTRSQRPRRSAGPAAGSARPTGRRRRWRTGWTRCPGPPGTRAAPGPPGA